jgi:hypothetical protein
MPKVAKVFNGNLEQALAADNEHLFIKNNIKGNHGILLFEIKDKSGKPVGIRLPKTWVPIDLMLFVDRESIKSSNDLRKLHRKGVIQFLDPKDSMEILKTKEAQEEGERAGLFTSVDFEDFSNTETDGEIDKLEVESVSDGSDSNNYLLNLITEVETFAKDGAEEAELINKIKDLKSAYFSDPDFIDKGKLILALNDLKAFLSDNGKAQSSEEVASVISSISE